MQIMNITNYKNRLLSLLNILNGCSSLKLISISARNSVGVHIVVLFKLINYDLQLELNYSDS